MGAPGRPPRTAIRELHVNSCWHTGNGGREANGVPAYSCFSFSRSRCVDGRLAGRSGGQGRYAAGTTAGGEAARAAGSKGGRQPGRQAAKPAGSQAGRQPGRQAARTAGSQAGRLVGRQAAFAGKQLGRQAVL